MMPVTLRVREGARQTMAWLHGWSGLPLGWALFVIALSGSLTVFRAEIGRWARPEMTATVPPAQAATAAIGWLGRNATHAPAWFLSVPDARGGAVEAAWFDGRRFVRRALDPVTGAPSPRDTLGGEFFYRLHFELQLPYPWGRLLASLAAAFLLVAIVTGVIAHARIFRDTFTFRPGKGQRSWLDAHNVFGVLSLPFHVMIAFTGLMMLATLAMPWGIVANYGGDTEKMYAELVPSIVERRATGRAAPLAPIAPMLAEAQRRFGGAPPRAIALSNPGDAAAILAVTCADGDEITRVGRQVTFDAVTGRVLADWREHGRPAVAAYDVLYGLHMAHFARTLLRWLYFAGGLALTATIASGLVLWVVKRRAGAPLSRANAAIERLNVGIVAGTPAAFAAFFLANRLVPARIEGRADLEIAVTFWVWGAVLLLGAALPARRGWAVLLRLAATLCAGVPVLDLVLPGAPLAAAILRGDGAIAGTDGVLMAAAIGFAIAARRARRASIVPVVRPRRVRAMAPA